MTLTKDVDLRVDVIRIARWTAMMGAIQRFMPNLLGACVDAVHREQQRGCRHAIRQKTARNRRVIEVIEGELFAITHSA
jgi:hypothetical protein